MGNQTVLKFKAVTEKEISSVQNNTHLPTHFATSHVQAVKSLASILLKEIELLETLIPKSEDFLKGEKISLTKAVAYFEVELIRTALLQSKGNQRFAARLLEIKYTTLSMKMKRYGIDPRDFTFQDSEYDC